MNQTIKITLIAALFFFAATNIAKAAINISPKVGNTACTTGLSCGLVGYWTFDGANMKNNVKDSSGQNNNGMLNFGTGGSISTSSMQVRGKIGQALKFDGADDYVNMGNPANGSLNFGTGDFSIEWWMRSSSATAYQVLVDKNSGSNELDVNTGASGNYLRFWIGGSVIIDGTTGIDITTGKWVNVIVLRTNGILKTYINGVFDQQGDATGKNMSSTASLYFGNQVGNINFYNGLMDDVRIYNRTLSANEITQLYKIGVGDKVAASPKVGNTACTTGLSCGLVRYWTFDGKNMKNNVTDSSGSGNNGYLQGFGATSTAVVAGKIGQGLKFDGVDDHVYFSASYTSNVTMSAWIKIASNVAGVYKNITGDSSGGSSVLRYASVSGSSFVTYDGVDYRAATPALTVNKWTHVVLTFTAATKQLDLYVNGVNGYSGNSGTYTNGYVAYLGVLNGGLSRPFNGTMDDVRIYNRALSASEITQLYKIGAGDKVSASPKVGNTACTTGISCGLVGYWTFDGKDTPWTSAYAGTTLDKSGNNNTGTLTNMGRATSTAAGKIGQALKFNGVNSYVDLGTSVRTYISKDSTFTISTWFNAKSLTSALDGPTIIASTIGASNRTDIQIYSGSLIVATYNGTAYTSKSVSITSASLNKWNHVIMINNGGVVSGYLNGVVMTSSASPNTSTPDRTLIGVDERAPYGAFNGSIDDVRIYSRALSANEVTQLYNLGK